MDLKTIERGAMTTDDVLALLSGDRRYGVAELTTTAIFEQPIPKGFQPMADELRAKLNLPKLAADAPRAIIYAAYGHDILLLDEHLNGFEQFMKMAVRASTMDAGRSNWDGEWDFVSKSMPALAREPLVNFSAEIAAQPEQELLPHLKAEIDAAVTKLFRIVCYWLDALVAREFVGLLKVTSGDAARYHYFRPLRFEKVLEEGDNQPRVVAYDETKPFGQRTKYEQKSGKLVEIKHDLERHDHDIVNMQTHTIADYPDPMPNRVVDFLNRTPAFIRHHLRVVSGVIIREQVLKRTLAVEMEDTRHTSTWLGSPALTLAGVFVPVGWSDRDMQSSKFFSGQNACPPPPSGIKKWARWLREHWRGTTLISGVVIALATLGALFWVDPRFGFAGMVALLLVVFVDCMVRVTINEC
jgi:hypothetical protein